MFHTIKTGSLEYLTADSLSGSVHCFSTRFGGVSEGHLASLNLGTHRGDVPENVRENYRILGAAAGFAPEQTVFTRQEHTDTILRVGKSDCGTGLSREQAVVCDGLITDDPGVALCCFGADCTTILLFDPVTGALGAVHSGWRGTSLGIAPQAVAKMTALYGSDPGDILAAIGPGIGPCCFETHDDVPSAMVQRLGEDILSHCVPLAHGKFSVDLKGIIHWQLTQAGLADGHVDTLSLCTACHPELYWSHRKMGDQRGNHAAMLQLLP